MPPTRLFRSIVRTMSESTSKLLSLMPPMEEILDDRRLLELGDEPRSLLKAWARESCDTVRNEIRVGIFHPTSRDEVVTRLIGWVRERARLRLELRIRPVWNATGILLHTNLGRAVLPIASRRALLAVASGYSSLEIDLTTGGRASRLAAVRELIPLLTGAEAGFAVNNNAAALFLTIAALAGERELLVSRGELVEIGGSFRLPDILEATGVRLREVGTTNRTRIADFERARSETTGLVLRVHRSNFRLVGFSEEPTLEELVAFCRAEQLPLIYDIGSGALRDHRDLFADEPLIEDAVKAGADIVCFSTDKLLGVGQAGVIAGRRDLVEEKILPHPIARTVRLDKTLLAVLEAGLRIHLKGGDTARREIPFLRALARDESDVAAAVERCAARLREHLAGPFEIGTVETEGEIGGGSIPGITIRSHAVSIRSESVDVDALASRLRMGSPPVIGRIREDRLLLDPRAIEREDEDAFVDAVLAQIEESASS